MRSLKKKNLTRKNKKFAYRRNFSTQQTPSLMLQFLTRKSALADLASHFIAHFY
jgi:hypothetical protein